MIKCWVDNKRKWCSIRDCNYCLYYTYYKKDVEKNENKNSSDELENHE